MCAWGPWCRRDGLSTHGPMGTLPGSGRFLDPCGGETTEGTEGTEGWFCRGMKEAVSTLAGCPPWDRRFSSRLTESGSADLGSGSGLGSVLTFGRESPAVLGFDLVSGGAVVSVRARAQREARCCREPWGSDEGAMRPGRPRFQGSRHGEGAMRSRRPCCVAGPRAFRGLPTYTGQPPCNRENAEVHVAAQVG